MITLTNDFHNTVVNLIPKNDRLSLRQIKRAKKELCGIDGCTCSGSTGTRGDQDYSVELIYDNKGLTHGWVYENKKNVSPKSLNTAWLDPFTGSIKYDNM